MEEITLHNGTSEEEDIISLNLLGMTFDEFSEVFKGFKITTPIKASEDLETDPDLIDYFLKREALYPVAMRVDGVPFLSLSWVLTVGFTSEQKLGFWKLGTYEGSGIPETTTNVIRNLLNKNYPKDKEGYNFVGIKEYRWLGNGFTIKLCSDWKSEYRDDFIYIAVEKIRKGLLE